MTVPVYTFADKRPDFLEFQKATLGAFLADPHELVVFNNGSSPGLTREIDTTCARLGLRAIRVESPNHSDPTVAAAYPIQWAFHSLIKHDRGVSVVLDSDMFPLRRFSFRSLLGSQPIAAVKQRRGHVRYLWNGIIVMHVPDLPAVDDINWMHGVVEGVPTDVGGRTYDWLRSTRVGVQNINYSGDISRRYGNLFCLPEEVRERYEEGFDFQIYASAILHYKRGSNWNGSTQGYQKRKWNLAQALIQGALDRTLELPVVDYAFKFPEPDGSGGYVMNYWESVDADEPFASMPRARRIQNVLADTVGARLRRPRP